MKGMKRWLAAVVLIGGLGMVACEEDPVGSGGHEEGDVASFRIREAGGAVLYEYPGAADADEDTLRLADDGATNIEIVWLDADGDAVTLEEDEHTWEFGDNHSGITTFVASGSDPWRGTITTNDLLSGAVVYGGFTITLRHGGEVELQTPQLVAAVEG